MTTPPRPDGTPAGDRQTRAAGSQRAVNFGRATAGSWVLVALGALVLGACGSGSVPPGYQGSTRSTKAPAPRILPAPAGLIAAGQPQAGDSMWLLAGSASVKTLSELDLSTGKITATLPASVDASSLAESAGGQIAIGLATPTGGALQIADPSTGSIVKTVPMPAQVRQIVIGPNGTDFFVVYGTKGALDVAIVTTASDTITAEVPVFSDAVSAVGTPDGTQLFVLGRSGTVEVVSVATRKVVGHFSVGPTTAAVTIASSNDGATLYAMKTTASGCNIAVIDRVSQQVTDVLAAPRDCVDMVLSADGSTMYSEVGSPTVGNVQAISLANS